MKKNAPTVQKPPSNAIEIKGPFSLELSKLIMEAENIPIDAPCLFGENGKPKSFKS